MLRKFLFVFPIKLGVYIIAFCSLFSSGVIMTLHLNLSRNNSIDQGNFGFVVVYFLSSLMLLDGIVKVNFEVFLIQNLCNLCRFVETSPTDDTLVDLSRNWDFRTLCSPHPAAWFPLLIDTFNRNLLLVLRVVAPWILQAKLRCRFIEWGRIKT